MMREITNQSKFQPRYGRVRRPEDMGRLVRDERRRQALTLEELYAATGLTTRFLSEFERGKAGNASIGRAMNALHALGLELLVLPRGDAQRALATLAKPEHPERS